jgi:hypothetical protein
VRIQLFIPCWMRALVNWESLHYVWNEVLMCRLIKFSNDASQQITTLLYIKRACEFKQVTYYKHWWRSGFTDRKLCSNKFTWCFHKQNYYIFYRHANIQRTLLNICLEIYHK